MLARSTLLFLATVLYAAPLCAQEPHKVTQSDVVVDAENTDVITGNVDVTLPAGYDKVEVTWRIVRDDTVIWTSQTTTYVTAGKKVFELDLENTSVGPPGGDTLRVEARWIGAGKPTIIKEHEVVVPDDPS